MSKRCIRPFFGSAGWFAVRACKVQFVPSQAIMWVQLSEDGSATSWTLCTPQSSQSILNLLDGEIGGPSVEEQFRSRGWNPFCQLDDVFRTNKSIIRGEYQGVRARYAYRLSHSENGFNPVLTGHLGEFAVSSYVGNWANVEHCGLAFDADHGSTHRTLLTRHHRKVVAVSAQECCRVRAAGFLLRSPYRRARA